MWSKEYRKLTWKTFLKNGLLAERITLWAVRHCPSLANVTSTKPSSSQRLSKLVAMLFKKLFHFRHIWFDISRTESVNSVKMLSPCPELFDISARQWLLLFNDGSNVDDDNKNNNDNDDVDDNDRDVTAVVPGTHKHPWHWVGRTQSIWPPCSIELRASLETFFETLYIFYYLVVCKMANILCIKKINFRHNIFKNNLVHIAKIFFLKFYYKINVIIVFKKWYISIVKLYQSSNEKYVFLYCVHTYIQVYRCARPLIFACVQTYSCMHSSMRAYILACLYACVSLYPITVFRNC